MIFRLLRLCVSTFIDFFPILVSNDEISNDICTAHSSGSVVCVVPK